MIQYASRRANYRSLLTRAVLVKFGQTGEWTLSLCASLSRSQRLRVSQFAQPLQDPRVQLIEDDPFSLDDVGVWHMHIC